MKKTINSTNIMNFLSINDIINDNNIDLLIGQIKEDFYGKYKQMGNSKILR